MKGTIITVYKNYGVLGHDPEEPTTERITGESFGADLPQNWEEIMDAMNRIIIDENLDHDQVEELWETYWSDGWNGIPAPIV